MKHCFLILFFTISFVATANARNALADVKLQFENPLAVTPWDYRLVGSEALAAQGKTVLSATYEIAGMESFKSFSTRGCTIQIDQVFVASGPEITAAISKLITDLKRSKRRRTAISPHFITYNKLELNGQWSVQSSDLGKEQTRIEMKRAQNARQPEMKAILYCKLKDLPNGASDKQRLDMNMHVLKKLGLQTLMPIGNHPLPPEYIVQRELNAIDNEIVKAQGTESARMKVQSSQGHGRY